MTKLIIIILIIFTLFLPMMAKAIVPQRPVMERCTLKHNLSSTFGPGFEAGQYIASVESATVNQNSIDALKTEIGKQIDDLKKSGKDPNKEYLKDKKDMQDWCNNKKGAGTVKWAIVLVAQSDICNGVTYSEAEKIINHLEWILKKLHAKDLPVLSDFFTHILQMSLGITEAEYHEDAALACMIDKIETAEDWFFVVFMVVAGALFLYGAFIFLTAAGKPESIKLARDLFIWGAVGLVIAFISKGLVRVITQMMV